MKKIFQKNFGENRLEETQIRIKKTSRETVGGCNTSIQRLACWDHVNRDTASLPETVPEVWGVKET